MDTYEATKLVMSRIQSLDPDTATKIMGYILIQDQGEKEMLRLAFVPDSLLLSYINQAKLRLGISSSSSTTKSNAAFPPKILIPTNGFHFSNPSQSPSPSSSPSPRPFSYATANSNGPANFYGELPFQDDSAVDPVMSPTDSHYGDEAIPHPFHRRSSSVNDAAFLSSLEEGGGLGWRPCMYFARGFCKNGSSCKFLHAADVGKSLDYLLRMKALQQQRFALMASPRGQQHFASNKCMDLDFLNENPRNEFPPMGLGGGGSSTSRQIYLTFPADSTFKEEDVSSYFSMFGPVQDVRIPFQQKRMFGFVTFLYPETVKLILAKGNPHFVCDSRVLVKPYKEKGKVTEKKQQQQQQLHLELSPSMENIDLPFGSRMLFNSQEMIMRRKLEQEAELHHAVELQGRRMMNLEMMDHKNQHLLQGFRAGLPTSSPRQSQFLMNQQEFDGRPEPVNSHQKLAMEGIESDLPESFDHILPENLFASPTKLASDNRSSFFEAPATSDGGLPVTITSSNTNPLSMASLKSCYVELPRQEAIEMQAGINLI